MDQSYLIVPLMVLAFLAKEGKLKSCKVDHELYSPVITCIPGGWGT